MKFRFVKISLLLLTITGYLSQIKAQNNLTLYNMHTSPQRILMNPAQSSDSRFFIGFPGFSSVHFLYGNNGFKLKNIVSVNDSNQLVVSPTNFYNSLNKNNSLNLNVNYDILYFGFKARKSFFTIGIGEKVKTQFSFPKDFFGLLIIGNAGSNLGKDLNFNFGYDLIAYNDINASWSRAFMKDKLRLGVKVSYLNGWANINTEKSDLIFNTHSEDFHYTARTDIKVNTSGIVDSKNEPLIKDGNFDINTFKKRNQGMGLSLGASFKPIPKVELSASIIDMGYINWKDNVRNYVTEDPSKTVEFYGVDFKTFFKDSVNFDKTLEDILDTMQMKFKIRESSESYRTFLPTNFYLGGNFWITKRHNFGILFYGNYYQKKLNPAVTISYNGKLTRVLGLSVSYSMINKSFVNGGIGFTLNGGPFQYYMVADNLLGIIFYRNMNTVDLRMGMNFTFLRKDKKTSKVN
jgi:hypothetical protein